MMDIGIVLILVGALVAAGSATFLGYRRGGQIAAEIVRRHHPDASFDDSAGGRQAQSAMKENIARDIELYFGLRK